MPTENAFKLSIQLEGHSGDVRGVAATSFIDPLDTLLLSASRDGTGRVWARPAGSKSKREMSCRHILEGHEGFVNSCAWLRHEDAVLAVTGGQDKTINAYEMPLSQPSSEISSLTPTYTLLGHEDNICALDVCKGPQGYIVSGSWDRTARVWKDWECVAVLSGHTQAVWAVLALTEDLVLTASADKIIRLYSISKAARQGQESKPISTFEGHTDAVRGLTRLSATSFASCSNDGTICIYPVPQAINISAPISPTQSLSGHTSFVYSLATLIDGTLASSGEDRSVRLWRDGKLQQTVTIPAISVWSVAGLANGDFACASSDNTVRIFTNVPQRIADPETLQIFETNVSSQALNKTQVGDVQKESLSGAEELAQPGREGQVKMIRTGELVEAYQYSSASGKWEKVGEVVGGVGSGQKKLYDGKEYDYVFDVDIADGVPPLKLPYNATENPYNAAYRFLEKNELPLTYLDQVVQFIEKNTEAVSLGSSNEFVDPYTGASSYRPGGASAIVAPPISVPPPSRSVATTSNSILPQRVSLTFKQFNEQGAKSKIEELNSQLSAPIAMSIQEMTNIINLLPHLSTIASGSTSTPPVALQELEQVLLRWPVSSRFPLLDIYRLACAAPVQSSSQPTVFALQAAQWAHPWPSNADDAKAKSTLSLLALRAVANGLSNTSAATATQVLVELSKGNVVPYLSKPARIAYASVLFNLSTFVVRGTCSEARSVLELLLGLLEVEKDPSNRDSEVIYRALVAFGNLLVSPSSGSLPVGTLAAAKTSAQNFASTSEESRIKSIVDEILQYTTVL